MSIFLILSKLRKHVKSNVVLISGLVLMIGLLSAIYMVEHANNSTMFQTAWDAVWWGIVTAATIGYGDKFPQSMTGQILATFYIIISLGIFTQLVSQLIDFIFTNNLRKMSGTLKYNLSNHTIVFGKSNDKTLNVANQFLHEFPTKNLVIITEDNEMPALIKDLTSKHSNSYWVSGNFENDATEENASISKASTIVVISDGDDNKTLAHVMFIRNINKNAKVTTDISNNSYKDILITAGANSVINTNELSSNLITRSVTDSTEILLGDILSNNNGHEVYLVGVDHDKYGESIKLSTLKMKYVETNVQIVGVLDLHGNMIYDSSYPIDKGRNDKVFILSENRMSMV